MSEDRPDDAAAEPAGSRAGTAPARASGDEPTDIASPDAQVSGDGAPDTQVSGDGTPDAQMFGDGTPDAQVSGDGTPDGEPVSGAPAVRRRRGRRIAILGAIGVVVIAAAIIVARWQRREAAPGTAPVIGDAGVRAAKSAPRGPTIPIDPNGVRLSGFVVDGSGAPVVGAEVSAELEQGAQDRSLSIVPRPAGAGSASPSGAGGGSSVTPAGSAGAAGGGPGASSAGAAGSGSGANAAGGGPGSASSAGVAGPGSASSAGAAGSGPGSASGAAGSGAGDGSGSAAAPSIAIAAPTAADGRFVLEGLPPGRYRIRVTGPGLLAAEVRYVPVPSDEARIVVARQVRIDGTVVDGMTPVANAAVGLRGDAIGGGIETRTDAAGAFHFPDLPEGRYQLYAWKGPLAARAVRVNRLGAGPFTPLELRLEAATIVVGRVIDRDEGTGLVAAIELRPSGDDQAPRYARSGEDGMFRIEGVPNGRWIADAFAPGYTSPGGVELDAGRGISELALSRGAMIEGRVLDGEGRPIAGAAVRSLGAGPNAQEHSAEVDQDRLRRFSGRMAAPAATAAPGGSTADPQLLPRGELGVLVGPIPPIPPPGTTIARPASIDPAIASLAGEPPPLAVDPARASIWTTGLDGRYRIRGLARGKTSLLAIAPGFAEGRTKPLALEAGQVITNVDIVLTPGTIVIGRITDQHRVPISGAQVSAKPELGAPLIAFSEPDGTYRLGPVTGTIELTASAYGHADAHRAVELAVARGSQPAERREDLVLVVADAILAGTLDDTTGAVVAAAQLEVLGAGEGRHAIVAADGTFSIDMLPEGPVRIRVTHPDYPSAELDAVASIGAKTRSRLRLALGGAVEGVLLDGSSGAPLAGLTIDGDGPGSATAEATTDKGGLWKLGPLVPGRWKLVVQQPGYVPATRELDVPVSRSPGAISVRDIRIDLARGAVVGGTVRDARGERIVGARITVKLVDGTGSTAEGTTDTAGEFRVRDAPTGELTVTATRGDARGVTRATVRPGDEVLGLSIELR